MVNKWLEKPGFVQDNFFPVDSRTDRGTGSHDSILKSQFSLWFFNIYRFRTWSLSNSLIKKIILRSVKHQKILNRVNGMSIWKSTKNIVRHLNTLSLPPNCTSVRSIMNSDENLFQTDKKAMYVRFDWEEKLLREFEDINICSILTSNNSWDRLIYNRLDFFNFSLKVFFLIIICKLLTG